MTTDTTPDPLAASAVRTWIEPPTAADTIMRAMTSPHLVRVPIGLRTYTGTAIVTGDNVLVIACHLGPVTGNRRDRRVVAMQLVRDEAAELRQKLAEQVCGPHGRGATAIDLPPANTGPLPVMVHEVREEAMFQAEPGSVLAEVAGAPQEPGQISDPDAYARAVERGSIVPLGADGQPAPYLLTVFNSDHGLTVTPAPSIERGTMKFGSLPGDIDRGGFVMQLQGPRVSRFHAVISIAGPERWTVTDCGTDCGTMVNGTRIAGPVEFGLGDAVLIGENTIKIGKRRPDADVVSSAGFNVSMIEVGGAADVYETGDPVIDALVAEGLAGLPSDWIGKAQAHGPMLAAVARMMRYGAGAIGPGFIPDASGELPSTTRAYQLAGILRRYRLHAAPEAQQHFAEAADMLEGLAGIDIGVGDTARFTIENMPSSLETAVVDIDGQGFRLPSSLAEAIRRTEETIGAVPVGRTDERLLVALRWEGALQRRIEALTEAMEAAKSELSSASGAASESGIDGVVSACDSAAGIIARALGAEAVP